MKHALAIGCALISLTGAPRVSNAESGPAGPPETIDAMVRSAGLIFRGTVRSVEYRNSEPDELSSGIPHTFVTYDVADVLKGNAGSQITLRFIGGPFGEGDERFLMLPHNPLFDAGDTDLLLVQDNLESGCPLVRCPDARFRIVSDLVVSELGQRVQLEPDGSLGLGPELAFAELQTHSMSERFQLTRYDDRPVGEQGPPTADEIRRRGALDPERDPTPEQFFAYMTRVIERAHTPEELTRARATPMPSADVRQPFRIELKPGGRVRGVETAPGEPAPEAEPQRAEREMHEASLPDPAATAATEPLDASPASPVQRSNAAAVAGIGLVAGLLLATLVYLVRRRARSTA